MNEILMGGGSENDITEVVAEELSQATSVLSNIADLIKSAIPTFIIAVICAIAGFIAIKILMRIISHALNRSDMDGIASGFLGSVIKIILYVLLAVIILSLLRVPMDSIVAVLISSSMAVALALKDSLSNVAGGFIISFAKPIKAGDVVEIDGSKGKVESVGMLYTKIVTHDNVSIYMPNGKVSSSKIMNYTEKEIRRINIAFCISYEDSIDHARNTILNTVASNSDILATPEPEVIVSAHESSSIELTLKVWVNKDNYWKVYYYLLEQVKKDFDRDGISIPYPQLDIHQTVE